MKNANNTSKSKKYESLIIESKVLVSAMMEYLLQNKCVLRNLVNHKILKADN
jgi:hypothetical protein